MKNRGRIFAWTLFDFANTAFSVIIVTVIFSKYFSNYVTGGKRWIWGLAVSISMILSAILSPPLGAIADSSRNRKRFLLVFTLVSIVSTALMFYVQKGDILLGFLLFVLANIGFEGGLVFYDAFLPNLTEKKNFGRVSGYGFAMGYLGALAVLLIVMMLLPGQASADYYFYIRLSFVVASAFFLVFSVPLFFFVREPQVTFLQREDLVKKGIEKSFSTLKALFFTKQYPAISRFLLAFFLYNDAILTIIAFASIFASNILKMTDQEVIYFFVIVQSTAVFGSFIFGIISDHIGPKKTISITLFIWIAVIIGAFFVGTIWEFYVVGLLAGLSIGSSQSSSRSLMALLTPKEREAEFFGFYDGLFGKSSAVVGPLVYGIVSDISNERIAALVIGIFFILGLIILQKIEEPNYKHAKSV
ncbi:MAG: MFS transporter [Ignavibacteria bacterium]|jgi:UMF1 family MFS transporter|nr:MFS transporter [Ignavibacteria bacterium]MCU7501649.1 MFS transporter [Ignavibacteria bacterium]MCU7517762.1 MFS transporter [Ignavibacteria bacterium]